MITNVRLSPGRMKQRRQDPHSRGLAGSIRSNKPKYVTRLKIEFDVVNGEQIAVLLSQVMCLDHG